jgi:chorismate-pyruvate lyase
MQRVSTPELLGVDVTSLDHSLRYLLFTDGTVTRALEAQTLQPVAVDVVEQSHTHLTAQAAHYLEMGDAAECLRRRVTMTTAPAGTPAVWAESHIIPARLPASFLGLLDSTPHGIGGSIERLRLESRRELLWFRLGSPPAWASGLPASTMALIRLYRIITDDRPALLIREAFAVESRSGVYGRLGWSSGARMAT